MWTSLLTLAFQIQVCKWPCLRRSIVQGILPCAAHWIKSIKIRPIFIGLDKNVNFNVDKLANSYVLDLSLQMTFLEMQCWPRNFATYNILDQFHKKIRPISIGFYKNVNSNVDKLANSCVPDPGLQMTLLQTQFDGGRKVSVVRPTPWPYFMVFNILLGWR